MQHGPIGNHNKNIQGEDMLVLNFRTNTDIDVIFKDNTIVNTTWEHFKMGTVIKSKTDPSGAWVGVTVTDEYGIEGKIIEYYNDDNVTVQYTDGSIVANLTLDDIANHNYNKDSKYMEGVVTEKTSGIQNERKRTMENTLYMLQRYRKCAVYRPCGFGKTYMGIEIFKLERYRRCLFLHPYKDDQNSKKIEQIKFDKPVDSKTYDWLINQRKKDLIKDLDYDIVFLDEIHTLGGTEDQGAVERNKAVRELMKTHPKTHFLGATATPIRTDGIDVIKNLFDGRTCYPYDMDDAIRDGYLNKPHYFYCCYNLWRRIRDSLGAGKKELVNMNREEIETIVGLSESEVNEIDSKFMDTHISDTCHKLFPEKNYLRFIAFYLTNDEIRKNKEKVLNWFRKAYPTYQVESIVVTAASGKSIEDIDKLPTKPDKGYDGRIDVIFNCEILCLGTHSPLVTGLILDRKTQSMVKYMQMIGRVFDCDRDEAMIIFDIFDNIHSDFLFQTPNPTSDTNKAKPVIPEIIENPDTYEALLAKYPDARDWAKIEESNKKYRKASHLLHEELKKRKGHHTFKAGRVIIVTNNGTEDPVATNNDTKDSSDIQDTTSPAVPVPSNESEALQQIDTSSEIKINDNISEDPDLYYDEDLDDFVFVADESDEESKEPEEVLDIESIASQCNTLAGIKDSNTAPAVKKTENNAKKEEKSEDSLGYNPGHYLIMQDKKTMYSKNIILENKIADPEEISKIARRILNERKYKAIIEKWHTYEDCKENYTSYEEVDKKSPKFKFLKSVSEFLYEEKVEMVLRYMVEGVA